MDINNIKPFLKNFSTFKDILHTYLLEQPITQSEALEVVKELHSMNMDVISYSLHFGETSISTPLNELCEKLTALAYLHPQEEYVADYLNKTISEFSLAKKGFYDQQGIVFAKVFPGFATNDLFNEIEIAYLKRGFEQYNIALHPDVLLFQEFESLSEKLLDNPGEIKDIQNFWNKHLDKLNTHYNLSSYLDYSQFPIKTNAYIGHENELNSAYRGLILYSRENIAENLLKYFVNYPEMQQPLCTAFPVYFEFTPWIKTHIKLLGAHTYFEDAQFDMLNQFKHKTGFEDYVKNVLEVPKHSINTYGMLLSKVLQQTPLWDKLFEDQPARFNNCTSLVDFLKQCGGSAEQKVFFEKLVIEYNYNSLQETLPANDVSTKRNNKI